MNRQNESKPRLCPFKKIIERDYNGKAGKQTINERFAPCAGERCMAYDSAGSYNRHCKLVEGRK